MRKFNLRKLALTFLAVFALFMVTLVVHIYLVYRPKAPDVYSRTMGRIDIYEPITLAEAGSISAWMLHQKGVDHVLVNPETKIVIFTFSPLITTGGAIASRFKAKFNLNSQRFMPTALDLKNGCPVAASSITYKLYKFITQTI